MRIEVDKEHPQLDIDIIEENDTEKMAETNNNRAKSNRKSRLLG
jgi:hypothetical protein